MAPGALTTTPDILAAAIGAAPGASIALDETWTSAQSPAMLAALTGDSTVTVVGGTDFVAVSPNVPNDMDLAVNVQVPHTNSVGTSISSRGHTTQDTHPHFGDQEMMFHGPDWAFADNAAPFDYVSSSPVGLKIYDDATVAAKGRAWLNNPMRHHGIDHDGHIVWIAELWDGTTSTYHVCEGYFIEGQPVWPGDKTIETDGVTHIRKLATLRIAAHAEDNQADNPARWILQPKRVRSAYTADATVADMAALETALQGLSDSDFTAGTSYVIALSAGTYAASGQDYFDLSSAAKTALAALTGGRRVFLIGTPEAVILPHVRLATAVRNLDFGWMTVRRDRTVDYSETVMRTCVYIAGGSDTRWFGIYVDGVDGAPTTAFVPEWANTGFERFELYDSILTGCGNGVWLGQSATAPANSRGVVARNFIECGNDSFRGENGRYRIEKNRIVIGGGYMQSNFQYQHPDVWQSQPAPTSGDDLAVCFKDNFADHGPGASAYDDWRQSGIQSMILNRVNGDARVNFVGNVIQATPGISRGLEMDVDNAIWPAEFSRNILFHRPDLISNGFMAPVAPNDSVLTPTNGVIQDNISGAINVFSKWNQSLGMNPLGIAVEWCPDADTGDRAEIAQPDEIFDSFPAVSGTLDAGYTLDYSGTTFAGTTREGFLAAADLGAQTAYRTYDGGGPALLTGAQLSSRLLDIPSDNEDHLGWDGADTDMPADLLEVYNPTARAAIGAETHSNPWGTPDNLEREITLNTKLSGTVSSGKIASETNGSAEWSVEVLGSGKVKFEVLNASGDVTHSVTSRHTVSANSHIAVHADLTFREWMLEFFSWVALEIMKDHRANELSYDRVFVTNTAATAPSSPTPGSGETYVWYDTSDGNKPKEWDGSAWVLAQGDPGLMYDLLARVFAGENINTQPDIALSALTIPTGVQRIYIQEHVGNFVHTSVATDDLRLYRKGGELTLEEYDGAGWGNATMPINVRTHLGWVRCEIRIDGKASLFDADWIWGDGTNGALPTAAGGSVDYSGYNQGLRYLEIRRGDMAGNALSIAGEFKYRRIETPGALWTFRRPPADAATGERVGLGAPQVWIRNGVQVPAFDVAAPSYTNVLHKSNDFDLYADNYTDVDAAAPFYMTSPASVTALADDWFRLTSGAALLDVIQDNLFGRSEFVVPSDAARWFMVVELRSATSGTPDDVFTLELRDTAGGGDYLRVSVDLSDGSTSKISGTSTILGSQSLGGGAYRVWMAIDKVAGATRLIATPVKSIAANSTVDIRRLMLTAYPGDNADMPVWVDGVS